MNFKKILAALLLFAFAATLVTTLPITVNAQAAPTKTYAVIEAIPNPVGVNEQTLIRTGILQQLGLVEQGWSGVTVTVVKPDNKTETLGPFRTDSTGVTFTDYVPAQAGTYKLTTNFPQQTVPTTFYSYESGTTFFAGQIMQASTSETIDLVVQEEPLLAYPGQALPTEYWSRPIDPQLREWYTIAGNWLARPDNSLALYNDDAPETAHVLWAKDMTTGGLTGGLWGDGQVPASSETGDAYEGKFPNSVILNGILYYQRTDIGTPNAIIAIDLHTGEQWLFRNNTSLTFGQVLYFNSFNYDGVFTYIWEVSGSTYIAYDPFTGLEQIRFTNVPSGTRVFGPSGEILIYQIDYANRWMALWNSTLAGLQNSAIGTSAYGSWGSQTHGRTFSVNNTKCYSWNVTIPAGLTVSTSFFTPILKVYPDRVMSVAFNLTQVRVWALSNSGSLLFDKTWKAPAEWLAGSNTIHYVGATNEVENGVIAVWSKELRRHYGFSTETGAFLWETDSEHYADAYGWGNAEHTWYFAYGKLYSVGIAGILYAYDLGTGDTAWTYELNDAYNEPVTGQNWWGWITLIADDKVYLGTLEHSAEQPLPRGAPQACVNATDGTEIWRINGMFRDTRWGGNGVIGDSIIATMDTYDQRVYAIGKGPSATTVTAPDVSVELCKSVIIKGTVTDISPGTNDPAITMRFPNGVAAVSDESQSAWMLYVYKQFSCPGDITGVPVTIDVIDANGNYRNIGTTTSDGTGFYSFDWVPDIPGKYTVLATFAGSKAYYPSAAQTAFVVDEAPAASAAPTETPPSMADMYFIPLSIGMIVAIIVIGAILALLLLRKQP